MSLYYKTLIRTIFTKCHIVKGHNIYFKGSVVTEDLKKTKVQNMRLGF